MDETAAGFYCHSEGFAESCPTINDETAPPTVGGASMEGVELEGENLVAEPRKVHILGQCVDIDKRASKPSKPSYLCWLAC